MADVVELLEPEDFYRGVNGKIYASIRGLFARGEPIDVITVAGTLEREGRLEEIGDLVEAARDVSVVNRHLPASP